MKDLYSFMDSDGFIGHKTADGTLEFGDSSQRTASQLLTCIWQIKKCEVETAFEGLYYRIANMFKMLDKGTYYIRHPDSSNWWGKPGHFSRDQAIPWIVLFGTFNKYDSLVRTFADDLLNKRFGFFWNTKAIWDDTGNHIPDFCGPCTLGAIIRSLKNHPYKFILWITDMVLILQVIFRLIVGYFDKDNVGDDLNLQWLLLQPDALFSNTDTLFSRFARWIYRFRNPQRVLDYYYRSESAPPINEQMQEIVKYYWN